MKLNKKNENKFGADWLNNNLAFDEIIGSKSTIEKEINKYITLKLIGGRTFIYVNGKRFIQCIRLILNIPKNDVHLYEEVDSIDEAAQLYSKHVFQNRIVMGPMARPVPNQSHSITPEQEFWGHCSNIQAWVEHDYDTRILMTNISFPLLRELTKAGDPLAKKVYKEEIALRLESGYPSVVQYLLSQRYIDVFNTSEFQTILESTDIIKNLSSDPKLLTHFIRSCMSKFPTLLEIILLQILKLPDSKKIFFSTIQAKPQMSTFRPYLNYSNPQFLFNVKSALENLFTKVGEKIGEDILDCIQVVNNYLKGQGVSIPNVSELSYLERIKNELINNELLAQLGEDQKFILNRMLLEKIQGILSRCAYCGKVIQKGQDVCDWCGHKKDDDEGGFFPYPFIFKPPGGGGSMKGTIAVPIKVKT
ncbi:MAG: zinc ribbon domain-containing protein [Promethearchaeota archaeon]